MKNVLRAGLLALLLATAGAQADSRVAVQADGESVMTMRIDGDLTIGTEGQVLSYSLRSKVEQSLQDLLAKAIPQWRLMPIQQGGKPVNARTPMRITLAANEVAGGFEVHIDNVVFMPLTKRDNEAEYAAQRAAAEAGEAIATVGAAAAPPVLITSRKLQSPGYPVGLMRAGVEGIVLLNLRLNPDGTVAEVFAAQSSLLNVRGNSELLDKARGLLEKESMRVAQRWVFTIEASHPETLDDDALTVRIPVEFVIADRGHGKDDQAHFSDAWRYEFRGPNLPAPWLLKAGGGQLIGVSDLTGTEQASGSTPFRFSDRSVLNQVL